MTPCELAHLVNQVADAWLVLPGVRGIGGRFVGAEGWLVVYVDDRALVADLPAAVDGVRVEIVEHDLALVPSGD